VSSFHLAVQARRSVVAHAGDDEVHKLQGEVSGSSDIAALQ
jgi:hypothetical protein